MVMTYIAAWSYSLASTPPRWDRRRNPIECEVVLQHRPDLRNSPIYTHLIEGTVIASCSPVHLFGPEAFQQRIRRSCRSGNELPNDNVDSLRLDVVNNKQG